MKKIRKVLGLIRVNWQTMAGFEILYKMISITVFTPLFWSGFNGIMKITGYSYLTIENIVPFLMNPITLAALILLFVCMAVYTMVDIGAVIYLLDCSYHGVKVQLGQTLRYALRNAVKVFHGRNILIAFVVLFLIPFLNIGVASSYVSSIAIPEFIMDFISKNQTLLLLFVLAVTGLSVLLLRWLYAFHYFTLDGCNFREARKRSADLSAHHKLKDLSVILSVQFLVYFLYFVIAFAGIILALVLGNLFTKLKLIGIVSASVVWVFLAVSLIVAGALGTPISYACISLLFYGHREERQEKIGQTSQTDEMTERYEEGTDGADGGFVKERESEQGDSKSRKSRRTVLYAALLVTSVAGCSFWLYGVYNHQFDIRIEYLRTMEVTAHRGASYDYPENTMAAFEGAKELGADWIELDVQQSRDGQIFVMHDTNLLRTAGVDRNTWETDYEDIRNLDVGSFFDKRFAGEHAPLLSEVIEFAKANDIKLNIEMKPTGHEQDFEQKVADIIEEAEFSEDCVITSQVYEVLENMKACDSRISTAYVMSIAYGDINRLSAADHFSIEASNITQKLVSDIHNAGKELYVWTVNTQESINHMIDMKVDNIITDDITLAKECIYLSKTSDVVAEYVKRLSD